MKITTKTGDKGTTSLFGGRRVCKDCPEIELVGALDELQAVTGWCKVFFDGECAEGCADGCAEAPAGAHSGHVAALLDKICDDLYKMMSALAVGGKFPKDLGELTEKDLDFLEKEIEEGGKSLGNISEFSRPGKREGEARLNIARTVCRRVEREFARAGGSGVEIPEIAIKYLNRLSDLFFVLGQGAKI